MTATNPPPPDAGMERAVEAAPIDMLLWCPNCHYQHVDAPDGEWINPPHKSHLCHECGTIWRPADLATNGVATIKTRGKFDHWVPGMLPDTLATTAADGENARPARHPATTHETSGAAVLAVGEAYRYLRRVFEHCAPQCRALPDMLGLCTQIDNLIAGYRIALGLMPDPSASTVEDRIAALEQDGGHMNDELMTQGARIAALEKRHESH